MKQKYILSKQEKQEIIKAHHLPILIWTGVAFCLSFLLPYLMKYNIYETLEILLYLITILFNFFYMLFLFYIIFSVTDPHQKARLIFKFKNDLPYIILIFILFYYFPLPSLVVTEHLKSYHPATLMFLFCICIREGFIYAKIFGIISARISKILHKFK